MAMGCEPRINTSFLVESGVFDKFGVEGVHVFQCRFSEGFYEDGCYSKFNIGFPSALAQAVPKRRAEYLAGRYCAKNALALSGGPEINIPINKDRSPKWPEGFIGSITHTDGSAYAAVCSAQRASGVGLDAEKNVSTEVMSAITRIVLCREEQDLLLRQNERTERMFTLAFSLKESFFKAAYPLVRNYFDFDAIEITDVDLDNRQALLRLRHDLFPVGHAGKTFEARYLLSSDEAVSLVILQ